MLDPPATQPVRDERPSMEETDNNSIRVSAGEGDEKSRETSTISQVRHSFACS